MQISIIPVQVQGEESVPQIVNALAFANRQTLVPFDAILLTRGGGSIEDLWSFNTEPVARAVFDSEIPVVTGIGHDTDITIADFVADLHAPTPSAAAELVSPDAQTLLAEINQFERSLVRANARILQQLAEKLNHLRLRLRHPGQRLQDLFQRMDDLEARLLRGFRQGLATFDFDSLGRRLHAAISRRLERHQVNLRLVQGRLISPGTTIRQHKTTLDSLKRRLQELARQSTLQAGHQLSHVSLRLDGVSPLRILESGYSIISREGQVMKTTASLSVGDEVNARLRFGRFNARITKIEE